MQIGACILILYVCVHIFTKLSENEDYCWLIFLGKLGKQNMHNNLCQFGGFRATWVDAQTYCACVQCFRSSCVHMSKQ